MDKKTLIKPGFILIIFVIIISFFGIVKPKSINNKVSEENVKKSSFKIAFVNEDKGTTYGGEAVNMADTLLKLFSNKSDYNVEVVTRAIAEEGLKNNIYQLMIILPSKFSEESLALESSNPTKAIFQYQIKSDKPLIVKQAEQAVLDFKSIFNKNLINIYFLSIIGNLQTAQLQVSNVVENEKNVLDTYENKLSNPLNSYPKLFEGISSLPNGLLNSYSIFDKELNQTNEAFTAIVDVDKTYEAAIETVKSLQDSWQNSIEKRENSLKIYDESFSKLSVEEQLTKLKEINKNITENSNEPLAWKDSIEKANNFNKELKSFIERLKTLNKEIDTTLGNYDESIKKAVEESINATEGKLLETGQTEETLGLYIKNLRKNMLSNIDSLLYNRSYYTDEALDGIGLSGLDLQYLKNINAFIRWYTGSNNKTDVKFKSVTMNSDYLSDIKNTAIQSLNQTKSLSFRGIQGTVSEVFIKVPVNYNLQLRDYQAHKIDNTTYVVDIPKEKIDSLNIYYSLTPIDVNKMSLLDSILLKGEVVTNDEITTVTGVDETKTVKEIKKVPINKNDPNSDIIEVEVETKIIQQGTKPSKIQRKYQTSELTVPFSEYKNNEQLRSFYLDIQGYLELSSIVKAFYDVDLHHGFTDSPKTSLLNQTDISNLKSIIVSLIKDNTIETLKKDLKFSDDELEKFEKKLINGEELVNSIEGLRKSTTDLTTELNSVIAETEKVHTILLEKPVFIETETVDNADLVTVALDMNKDLVQLMGASQTLMNNTKSNQIVSKEIKNTVEQLSSDVDKLEEEGKSLSIRVNELNDVMSKEYESNEDFLKSFATVLNNTKIGNKKNDVVYEYLSNPVDASKIKDVLGINSTTGQDTTRQDDRSGLLIVLISYLSSLCIAYLLQHTDINLLQKQFRVVDRINFKNSTQPIMFLTIFSVLSGVIISVISSYKLGMAFGGGVIFCIMVIIMMLSFTYGINALISKAKSFGFIVAITILLLYIITAAQLFDSYYEKTIELLSKLSLLTYVENGLRLYINGADGWIIISIVLGIVAICFGILNGFIYRTLRED